MLKNYFKLAWRNLWKYKSYSLINIGGLSLGLACCLLITLYLKDEWSFDRFHTNADQLYKVGYTRHQGEDGTSFSGRAQRYLGPVAAQQVPGIKNLVRLADISGTVQRGNEVFLEQITAADKNFFRIFSFSLVKADAASVLDRLQDVVLTRVMALKYFGREDIVGEKLEIRINGQSYQFIISAVAENVPENSSIRFGIVINAAMYEKIYPPEWDRAIWTAPAFTTFLLLHPDTSPARIAEGIDRLVAGYPGMLQEQTENGGETAIYEYQLDPLMDIHLRARVAGVDIQNSSRPEYGYLLSLLAGVVMLIACLNYLNLSLSQSMKRKREIGVRKTMGAGKRQLAWQFSVETLLIISLAMLFAIVIVSALLPWFNQLSGKALRLAYFADWRILFYILILLLITVVITSLKPAFFAIKLNTVGALQNRKLMPGRAVFARSLVMAQFFLATILIIASAVINLQSGYLTNASLGYNDKNLLVIELPLIQRKSRALKTELVQYPRFQSAALGILFNGFADEIEVNDIKTYSRVINADENFLNTLQVPLKAGRGLGGAEDIVLVNETFVERFGLESPVGKRIKLSDGVMKTIAGVVEDYHYAGLRDERIMPLYISSLHRNSEYKLYLRLPPGNVSEDLSTVSAIFRKHFPYYPFKAQFQEDLNRQQYVAELRWQKIVNHTCGMAIFVACCGLLALSLLSAQKRTKEIGIRKILGASVSGVVALLSTDFLKPVLIAVLLASPPAWYLMNKWLEDFAYRISLEWWMFVLTGLLAVIIALFTVSFQSVKAALANPADSLRSE